MNVKVRAMKNDGWIMQLGGIARGEREEVGSRGRGPGDRGAER